MVECGLYFNMPEDVYHYIPALSASGIKNILVSPMDFWARSWMAPDFIRDRQDNEAMMIGKAYHKRILEGHKAFYDIYAPEFEAPKGCLVTKDDIQQALTDIGVPFKKSSAKPEIVRIANENGIHNICETLERDYKDSNVGKEFLASNLIGRIEIAAAMIENHPELRKCFNGGYPEVSVVWEENGILFKSRIDYLKTKAVVDLKTFANMANKPIERAIYGAMASGKYHIQAAFYLHAVEMAKKLARPSDFVGEDEWLGKFTDCESPDFFFVFQQKGIAPVARAFKFGAENAQGILGAANSAIDQAIQIYKIYMERYGHDPWVDMSPIGAFHDDEFPVYTTEL